MGIGLIVAGASLAISIGLTAFTLLSSKNSGNDNLSPETLESLQITQAREGSFPPFVYGTVRLPGNIIFYGNLVAEEIEQETPGGKGGGGSTVVGFRYYLDVWQSICQGEIQLLDFFVNNKDEELIFSDQLFNNSNNGVFPTEPGADANEIKGVSHIFWKRLFLGENSTSVPNIHFVVNRVLNTGLPSENMANGNNPAAIIYDLILQSGISGTKIDFLAFQKAATYWGTKGYGLNIIFDKQETFGDAINKVLSFVDGTVFINKVGKISIYAFDPSDTAKQTFNEKQFSDFFIRRASEDILPNDFRATYTDKDQEFTKRTVITQNQALIDKVGERKTESIDLSGFNDLTTASKRLTEIMKTLTYPAAEIEFLATNLKASLLVPGDVITVSNSDLGIVNLSCRVTRVTHDNIDKNSVGISAIQIVETIFDSNFFTLGGTQQQLLDLSLDPLDNIKIFELPYNTITGFDPSYLVLAERKKTFENGYAVLVSDNAANNFSTFDFLSTFAQRGTLTSNYPVTRTIDNEIGIEYTTTKFDPVFSTISETQLFTLPRLAVIGNELIAFREVQSVSPNNYKLLGCVRSVLGTPRESHLSGSEIWLVNIGDNIIKNVPLSTFFVKILPAFQLKVLSPVGVPAITVTSQSKARKPRNPARIKVTRTGSNIDVQLFPNTPGVKGNGEVNLVNTTTQPQPYPFLGDFIVEYDANEEVKDKDSFSFVRLGAFDLTVKSRINGFLSSGLTINVGAGDGEYIKNN